MQPKAATNAESLRLQSFAGGAIGSKLRKFVLSVCFLALQISWGGDAKAESPDPSIDPPAAVVCVGQSQKFTLIDAPAGAVVHWSVTSPNTGGGTITTPGTSATYTAPASAVPNVVIQASVDGGDDYTSNVALYERSCLNDTNESFQLIGGVEESGFSSLGTNTNAFVQAFTESPASDMTPIGVWGRIRLLGAPQQTSNGIISTFTDPTGALQKQDFSKVGQAIDLTAGFKIANWKLLHIKSKGVYSVNPIFDAGFTTPLNSQDVVLRYAMPDLGTVECQQLQIRFAPALQRSQIKQGTTSCLVANDGNATKLPTPITELALSNQDRSNFYGKWGVGVRTTTRFRTSGDDPERGIIDFTFGQDADVSGGQMRHFVLKLDGVHPLPIGDGTKQYLYLFGSATIRLRHNQNLDPLILKTLDASSAAAIPSLGALVLPLQQADRDFYRIGLGLNFTALFSKLTGH